MKVTRVYFGGFIRVALIGLVAIVAAGYLAPSPASAATITVDTASPDEGDDGECSLTEAIDNANDDAPTHVDCVGGTGEDRIDFDAAITLITLTFDLPHITDLDGLTIDGDGAVTIDGNDLYHPFVVEEDVPLTLQSIVVTKGLSVANGGNIENSGALNVVDSEITDGNADEGGGIWNGGVLIVTNSSISNNEAVYGGGIMNAFGASTEVRLGSMINGNHADRAGGIASEGGLGVVDSTVSGNTADEDAGGILNEGTLAEVARSEVSGNSAVTAGGGIENQRQLILKNTTLSNNTTPNIGGGLYNVESAEATLLDNTFVENEAESGGGIWNGESATLTMTGTTLTENEAQFGAGLYSDDATANVANSTFSGNLSEYGGGLYNSTDSSLNLTNVTITDNEATTAGGGVYALTGGTGDVKLKNTIVADQQSGGDCAGGGSITSDGNNLDSDGTCNLIAAGDIPSGDANLGLLASNGGDTQTHALLTGSDAIDAGNDTACASVPVDGVDQRMVVRPIGAHCDIGAFEAEAQATATPTATPEPTATATPTGTPAPSATPGAPVSETWVDGDCDGEITIADAMREIEAIGLPETVEPIDGCPDVGQEVELVSVNPSGAGAAGIDSLIWGDYDCNGNVELLDVLIILRHLADLTPLPGDFACPQPGDSVLIIY